MIKLISEDSKIYKEYQLSMYLYDCYVENKDAVIDFNLEGPCCRANHLYTILDTFCQQTAYLPERITILTGNLLEHHPRYNVVRKPEYWYEVGLIKQHDIKRPKTTTGPTKHFGIFIGRATWARAWVSAILYRYRDKLQQTFHSGYHKNYVVPRTDGTVDTIGLDDLNRYGCNIIPEVTEFLQQCPIIDNDNVDKIKKTKMFIEPSNDDCYPIQHPANLNILDWYDNIFVDIVCETRVIGNVFFISEKTWRCMVARKPFIVVGPGNFLKNLRRLGFRTFHDFWDEGYDEYGPTQRIQEIEKLIQELSTKTVGEMQQLVNSMQSILDHNFDMFHSLTYEQIERTFND